jgi:hypothetical protein
MKRAGRSASGARNALMTFADDLQALRSLSQLSLAARSPRGKAEMDRLFESDAFLRLLNVLIGRHLDSPLSPGSLAALVDFSKELSQFYWNEEGL